MMEHQKEKSMEQDRKLDICKDSRGVSLHKVGLLYCTVGDVYLAMSTTICHPVFPQASALSPTL